MVLDADFLAKLERLTLLSKQIHRGATSGERRSSRWGHSVEFADYKTYSVGDDFRYVDWNIFGRLERLFLKLFLEEEDLHVYILIDTSASMNFGTPTKLEYAAKIAAALAYISLVNLDRVSVATFNAKLVRMIPPVHGKGQIFRILKELEQLEPKDGTNLHRAAADYSLRIKRTGVALLISDFLDPQGYQMALKRFLHRNFEVFTIHLLSPEEINPTVTGDLKLTDAETGETCEISTGERTLNAYRRTVQAFCNEIESYCRKRGIRHIRATTNIPFEDLILNYLRHRNFVR